VSPTFPLRLDFLRHGVRRSRASRDHSRGRSVNPVSEHARARARDPNAGWLVGLARESRDRRSTDRYIVTPRGRFAASSRSFTVALDAAPNTTLARVRARNPGDVSARREKISARFRDRVRSALRECRRRKSRRRK